jgi:tripartite-type tricarboxylate transporter receptor subunit TctC
VPALPQLRSLAVEAGAPALDDVSTWIGLVAPAGTPRAIVDLIQREVAKIYADPALIERLQKAGISPVAGTPEEFTSFMASETPRWGKVIKDSGIELN